MTPLNGVVQQRLTLLEQYVQQLERYRTLGLAELQGDIGTAWAVEHGLQLAIQCVIDVCYRIVAEMSLGSPGTSQDAIELLRDAGAFTPDFARSLVAMVRFRNILVHAYAHVDVARVHENLASGLDDFRRFSDFVRAFINSAPVA